MVLQQVQFTSFRLDIRNVHMFLPTKNNANRRLWVRVSDGCESSRGRESFKTLTNVQDDLRSPWGSWLQQGGASNAIHG